MISEETLTLDWINTVSRKNRNADRILIEKVIRALLLLEGLVESRMDFILKGGTALMLLQGSTKRLSIDVDIVMEKKPELEPLFESFLKRKKFTRVKRQERNTNSSIKKFHYKFYYQPAFKTSQEEEYVLLDILIERFLYKNMLSVDINSSFVQQNSAPLKINVPSFTDMLGDKLTAFAPNTIGIPYEKNGTSKTMEIIKQLYDIGNLFDEVENLEIVRETFNRFALKELSYRNLGQSPNQVLMDIFETALCISTRGLEGHGNFRALQNGISQIRAFIFSETYQIEKAIVHASKVAYLAKLLELNKNYLEHFKNAMQVRDWIIKRPFFTRLNRLKRSNPQAFFYWYKTYELVK
ncbi:hypothetical protein DRI50_03815 [candidate division KSB1 bacterium]|nr:MAG: hypothetical protein DRI50_03815 [candidate division KSB1 bacterium]